MTPAMNRFFVLSMLVLGACYLLPLSALLQSWLYGALFPASRAGWLAVGVMFAGVALTARHLPWRGMRLLYAAVVLVCLPVAVAPSASFIWTALCQLSLLTMAVLMTGGIAGNAHALRSDRVVVTCLMMAGGVVALWTLCEFYLPALILHLWFIPAGLRVSGLLMQPNVTGSFLAVVVTLGLWRWLRGGQQRTACWLGGLAVVMAAMHTTQSTIALLGTVAGFALLYLAYGKGEVRAFGLAGLILLGGWVVTLWHPGFGVTHRTYDSSWAFRLQMLHSSLALVMAKPWLGWGYGSFAGAFPKGLAILGEPSRAPGAVPEHPHNELMYWMAEGGVVAAAGIVLIAVWGLRLLIQAFPGRQSSESALRSGDGWGWCVCVIPVVMHMQTEFPLYSSALHWLVLSVCLGMSLAAVRERDTGLQVASRQPLFSRRHRPWLSVPARCVGVVAGGAVIWLTLTAVRVDMELKRLPVLREAYPVQALFDARALNPWVDQAIARHELGGRYLIAWANGQRDRRVLDMAIHWLRLAVDERPDARTWRLLIRAYQMAGDRAGEAAAREGMREAVRGVPPDEVRDDGIFPASGTSDTVPHTP